LCRLEIGKAEYVAGLVGGALEQDISLAYEAVCREICLGLMEEDRMQFTAIGQWWSRSDEIDLVALDEETRTAYFGGCKWSKKKVGVNVHDDLKRKSHQVDWHRDGHTDRFMLFSKSGFTDAIRTNFWHETWGRNCP